MTNSQRKFAIVSMIGLTLLFFLSNHLFAQALDQEAAKKEGRIVVYGTTIPKVMAPIHTGFEKRYGVKIDYWRASATAVTDRAITEWRAGKPGFDVVFAINGTITLLKRENALAKFTPPAAAKFPAHLKDKDGVLTAFRHTPLSILYNTELVKPADLPKDFDDLLNPKWQRKIAMPILPGTPVRRNFSGTCIKLKVRSGSITPERSPNKNLFCWNPLPRSRPLW
ncbi:MAG TPA: extracellular solute-binding protein [Gammaproteobacteria bacterium]|nr:extracellular solute-binding protein [Gammaproteobacteria bacterium]